VCADSIAVTGKGKAMRFGRDFDGMLIAARFVGACLGILIFGSAFFTAKGMSEHVYRQPSVQKQIVIEKLLNAPPEKE